MTVSVGSAVRVGLERRVGRERLARVGREGSVGHEGRVGREGRVARECHESCVGFGPRPRAKSLERYSRPLLHRKVSNLLRVVK